MLDPDAWNPPASLTPPAAAASLPVLYGRDLPRPSRRLWPLPLSVLLLGMALTAALAWTLADSSAQLQHKQAALVGSHAEQLVSTRLNEHVAALVRLRDRQQAQNDSSAARALFELDGHIYLRDFPGFETLRLVDARRRVRMTVERKPGGVFTSRGEDDTQLRSQAFERAEQTLQPQMSAVFPLPDRRTAALLVVPSVVAGKVSGYVVCTLVFDTLVPGLLTGMGPAPLHLLVDEASAYASGAGFGPPLAERRFEMLGHRWILRLWQVGDPPYPLLPSAVLGCGLLLSLLLASALWLAALARQRAEQGTVQALELGQTQAQKLAALQALQSARQEHDGVLDSMSDAFITVDGDLRVQALNRRAMLMLNLPSEEQRYRPLAELLPVLGPDAVRAELMSAVAGRRELVCDLLYARRDRWLEVRVQPRLRDVAIYMRDISLRKQAELEALRREEGQVRAQKLARFGSWEFDIDGGRLQWSDQLLEIFGIDCGDVSGDPEQLFDFVHPDDATRVRAMVDALFAGAVNQSLSYRIVRTDGELRDIEELATSVNNKAGEVAILTGVLRDVTDARRMQLLDARQRDILQLIARQRPLEECLQPVCGLLSEHLGGMASAILEMNDDRQRLRVLASLGLPESIRRALQDLSLEELGAASPALSSGEPGPIVADLTRDPRFQPFRALTESCGIRCFWALPVTDDRGQIRGHLILYFQELREPRPTDLELMHRMCTLAGIAMAQQRAVSDLLRSEQRFRSLFDQHPDGIAMLDSDGVYRLANASHARVTGLPASLLLGRSIADMPWPAERLRRTRDALHRALNGEPTRFESVDMRGDREDAWLETVLMPLVVDRQVEGAFLSVRDLSPLRRAEGRLLERDQFFELSLEAFCVLQPPGFRLLQVNPALARLLGVVPEAMTGRTLGDFVREDERAAALETWNALLDAGPDSSAVVRLGVDSEHQLWLEWIMRRAPDGRVFAAARDVTARQRAERSLALTLDDLRQRNQELSDFAFVASHDLQEPLRKIRAFSDRILDRYTAELDEQGRFYLERMSSASERMQALLDNLLAYSRVSSQQRPFEAVALDSVIANVVVDLETRIEASQARIQIGRLPVVMGDPVQLRQLFQNLLANALKFTVPGRRPMIAILALHDEDNSPTGWVIEVTDNGIGFDPQYADRMFGPFQRMHAREQYEGLGMGLAIVKRIVERHGGRISATAAPQAGATFRVHMPDLYRPPAAQPLVNGDAASPAVARVQSS